MARINPHIPVSRDRRNQRKLAEKDAAERRSRKAMGIVSHDDAIHDYGKPPKREPEWNTIPKYLTPQQRQVYESAETAGKIKLARQGGVPYAYQKVED